MSAIDINQAVVQVTEMTAAVTSAVMKELAECGVESEVDEREMSIAILGAVSKEMAAMCEISEAEFAAAQYRIAGEKLRSIYSKPKSAPRVSLMPTS